jgi:hypothetical protein
LFANLPVGDKIIFVLHGSRLCSGGWIICLAIVGSVGLYSKYNHLKEQVNGLKGELGATEPSHAATLAHLKSPASVAGGMLYCAVLSNTFHSSRVSAAANQ